MGDLLLLQQARTTPRKLDPWMFWDAATIASVTQCPLPNVESDWPAIFAELHARDIATKLVCGGVLGTIAIETASQFKPVREAFYLGDGAEAHRKTLQYYPWYGRGYVQLTWKGNYADFGSFVDVDLLSDPDRAMVPNTAAKIIAEWFARKGVAAAAEQADWTRVRIGVLGGTGGLDRLISIVKNLGLPN
jgi:predicted chitinase